MKQTESDSIYSHKHIILGEDSFVLLGFVQAMGRAGIRPVVVLHCPDYITNSCYIHRSRYSDIIHKVKTPEDALQLVLDLYGREEAVPFLYPLSETEIRLVDDHFDELKGKFCFFNGGGQGALHRWFEKINQCLLARQCGLPVPESEIVAKGSLPKVVKFPVFIKASNSINAGNKADAGFYRSKEELLKAYGTCSAESYLVQQYIDKVTEDALLGISFDGGNEIYIPFHYRFERLLDRDFGSYMYYEKFRDDEMENKISAFLRSISYSGVFEAEFIESKDGKLYFLEVNLRFSGYWKGASYGGANLPLLWAQATLDGHINKKNIKLMDRRFYALDEIRDFDYSVYKGEISVWRWIHDLFTADVLFHFDSEDPVPGLLFYRDWIWYKFKRLLRKMHLKFCEL